MEHVGWGGMGLGARAHESTVRVSRNLSVGVSGLEYTSQVSDCRLVIFSCRASSGALPVTSSRFL
jgi:hypothetical protein